VVEFAFSGEEEMRMRVTVYSTLLVVLTGMAAPVRLRAESSDARETFRSSIEATARSFASGQSATDAASRADWNRLARLVEAARIVIRTRDGQAVHAVFVAVDDVSLTAVAGTLRRSFARAEIAEVTNDPKGSTAGAYIGTFIGISVGAGLGANLALRCAPHCGSGDSAAAALAFIGTTVGLGFAGYYGLRAAPELIYHAP